MFSLTKTSLKSTGKTLLSNSPSLIRCVASQAISKGKAEGDISAVFPSLSGVTPEPLPERFTEIKRQLIKGNEGRLTASWQKLLEELAIENDIVKQRGPDIIPQIEFEDLKNIPEDFIKETKKRGVAVIKGVVPEQEARSYKTEVEEYVARNPSTKGMSHFN